MNALTKSRKKPMQKSAAKAKLTDAQKVEIFNQYQEMVYSMASKFSLKFNVNYHDMIDEGMSILGALVTKWDAEGNSSKHDPAKSSRTSWVYRALYWDLTTVCTRTNQKARLFSTLRTEEQKPVDMEGPVSWMEKLMRDLGEDAKILVRTIFMAPAEIVADIAPGTKGKARKAVREYLLKHGTEVDGEQVPWSPERLDAAWEEVTVAL